MGAGNPGIVRGKEFIILGPGLGLCLLASELGVFILIGGGTNTVLTWTGLEVTKGGRVVASFVGGPWGTLLCWDAGAKLWTAKEGIGALGRSCFKDIVFEMTGNPMPWDMG